MSDHSRALVPIECWCYNSPELRDKGISVDIGLLAEALIYYDQVLLNVANQLQFGEFLNWFIQRNLYSELLALFKDETIKIYEYSFFTSAILKDGVYSLRNIQDPIQEQPNTFEQRYLYHKEVEKYLSNVRQRNALYSALRGKVIEAKSVDFASAIENARDDLINPSRHALILQAFLDELYPLRKLGKPPQINVQVKPVKDDPSGGIIDWNINLDTIAEYAGKNLNFHQGVPLIAGAICNRTIWSAAQLNCDLYLGRPISMLAGDKLFESSLLYKPLKPQSIITKLEGEVAFPDIRCLVNKGVFPIKEILKYRKEGKRFRNWLQTEKERDRNAIFAYHNEVAKELGFRGLAKKSLNLFGVIGGGTIGTIAQSLIERAFPGIGGEFLGPAAGSTAGFLLQEVATKMQEDWKPVVFGNWMADRITKLLAKEKKQIAKNSSEE